MASGLLSQHASIHALLVDSSNAIRRGTVAIMFCDRRDADGQRPAQGQSQEPRL